MRKLLVLLVGLIGLGLSLSGCSLVGTAVKNEYIQKNYIDKTKVPKNKVIGDPNVRFYVRKVVDSRKTKHVLRKPIYGIQMGAKVKLANFTKTIKEIIYKALKKTGWGTTKDIKDADYVIDDNVTYLHLDTGLLWLTRRIKSKMCIYSANGNKILAKDINKESRLFATFDFSYTFKYVVGDFCQDYYLALVNYFGSKEFKDAIMRDYLSHLPSVDNATE